MASKYEQLVGQVVNGVYVLNYERVKKVSKTGRNYTTGRFTVAYEASKHITLSISISSFNKWSFIKNLNKLNGVNTGSSKTTSSSKKQQKTTKQTTKQTKTKNKATKQQLQEVYNTWYKTYLEVYKTKFKEHVEYVLRQLMDVPNLQMTDYEIEQYILQGWNKVYIPVDNLPNETQQVYDTRYTANYDAWYSCKTNIKTVIMEVLEQIVAECTEQAQQYKQEQQQYSEQRQQQRRQQFEDNMRAQYGDNWEEAWQRKNFGETTTDTKDNEFTVQFKGCKTVKEVKSVYRKLAKAYHSDLGGNDKRFILLHDAYEAALKRVA